MAGILDKIKGMFSGNKPGTKGSNGSMDHMKTQAGQAKDRLDGGVDRSGDKLPGNVKDGYDKASDKVEDVIPGDKDHDGH